MTITLTGTIRLPGGGVLASSDITMLRVGDVVSDGTETILLDQFLLPTNGSGVVSGTAEPGAYIASARTDAGTIKWNLFVDETPSTQNFHDCITNVPERIYTQTELAVLVGAGMITYTTSAEGIDNTTNGQFFMVPASPMGLTIFENVSGVATARGSLLPEALLADGSSVSTAVNTQAVTDLTALAALDQAQWKAAIVQASGLTHIWTPGNWSAQVTALNPRFTPPASDPTGASGAWIAAADFLTANDLRTDTHRTYSNTAVGAILKTATEGFAYQVAPIVAVNQHLTNGGGLKLYVLPDGDKKYSVDAFIAGRTSSTDITAAIHLACNDVAGNGGVVKFSARGYPVRGLTITKAVYMDFTGPGVVVGGGIYSPVNSATELTFDATAPATHVLKFDAGIDGSAILGGGILGQVGIDGSNVATHALWLDGCAWMTFQTVFLQRCTQHHLLGTDLSGPFCAHNKFENVHVQVGTNAATANANGIAWVGTFPTNAGTTSNIIDHAVIEYRNGTAVTFDGVDTCTFGTLKNVEILGGTGIGVHYKNNAGFQTQKNFIADGMRLGRIVAENQTIANTIVAANSEAFQIDATGYGDGTTGALNILTVKDFHTGANHATKTYVLQDLPYVSATDMRPIGGATEGVYGGLDRPAIIFADGATQRASFTLMPDLWYNGTVTGVRLHFAGDFAGANDTVRFQLEGHAFSPEVTVFNYLRTVAQNVDDNPAGNTYRTFDLLFGSGNNVPFVKEQLLAMRISRIGADAADNYAAPVFLLGAQVLYTAGGWFGGMVYQVPKRYVL